MLQISHTVPSANTIQRASPRKHRRIGRWNAVNQPFTPSPAPSLALTSAIPIVVLAGPVVATRSRKRPIHPTSTGKLVSPEFATAATVLRPYERIIPGSLPRQPRTKIVERSGSWEQVEQRRLAARKSLEKKGGEGDKPSQSKIDHKNSATERKETRIVPLPHLVTAKTTSSSIPVLQNSQYLRSSVSYSPYSAAIPLQKSRCEHMQAASHKRKTPEPTSDAESPERWSSKRLRSRKKLAEVNITSNPVLSSSISEGEEEEPEDNDHRNEGAEYEVEKIIAEAIGPRGHEFLVQWVGYAELDWIPAADCFCPEKIEEFRRVPRTKFLAAKLAGEDAEAGIQMMKMTNLADAASRRSGASKQTKLRKARIRRQRSASPKVMSNCGQNIDLDGTELEGLLVPESALQAQASPASSPLIGALVTAHKERTEVSIETSEAGGEEAASEFVREGSMAFSRNKRSNTAILPSKRSRGKTPAGWLAHPEVAAPDMIHIRSIPLPRGSETASTNESIQNEEQVDFLTAGVNSTSHSGVYQQQVGMEVDESGGDEQSIEDTCVHEVEAAQIHQQKLAEARRLLKAEYKRQASIREARDRAEEDSSHLELLEMLDKVEEVQRQDTAKSATDEILELTVDLQSESRTEFAPFHFKAERLEATKKRERLARGELDRKLINASAEKLCSESHSPPKSQTTNKPTPGGDQKLRRARCEEKEKKRRKISTKRVRSEFVGSLSEKHAKRLLRLCQERTILRSIEV